MKFYPELPYLFTVMTPMGNAMIDFPAIQWDIAAAPKEEGPGAPMLNDYIAAHGIGFRGQLFTLEAVSPMDLHHALLMNETTHHSPLLRSFEVIGYVPEENPDAEDDSRWEDEEGDGEGNDYDPLSGFDTAMDEERLESILEAAATDDWKLLKQLFEGPELGNRFGDGLNLNTEET